MEDGAARETLLHPEKTRMVDLRRGKDVKQVIAQLNPVLRGWGNYFRTGTWAREFLNMDSLVYQRLVRWFYRRGGQRPTKQAPWTSQQLHSMGWHRLRGTVPYPAQAAPAKIIVKPCAGKPHARFERGFMETGRRIAGTAP